MSQPTEEPPPAPPPVVSNDEDGQAGARKPALHDEARAKQRGIPQKMYDCLTYVPPRCRYDPETPFEFSMGLNLLFGRPALQTPLN